MYAATFIIKGRVRNESGGYRVFVVRSDVRKAHISEVVRRVQERIPGVECWRVPVTERGSK